MVEAKCEICGEMFLNINRYIKKTCSKKCMSEHIRRSLTAEPIDRECVICNTIFTVNCISNKKKTCSPKCAAKLIVKNTDYINRSRINVHNERIEISEELKQILDGEMLGDGSLSIYNPKNSELRNALFAYGTKQEEYAEYLRNILLIFDPVNVQRRIGRREYKGEIKEYIGYWFNTKSNISLTEVYHRWYKNKKKIIPRDLILTPLVCKHWYVGDGSLKDCGSICLHTNGFTKKDVEFLSILLNELGFNSTINTQESKYTIYIPVHSVKKFLDYIGEPPVECYKYKWDIPEACSTHFHYPYNSPDLARIIGINGNITKIINYSWFPKDLEFKKIGIRYRFNQEMIDIIKKAYDERNQNKFNGYPYGVDEIAKELNIKPNIHNIMSKKYFPRDVVGVKIKNNIRFDEESFNKIIISYKEYTK